MSFTTVFSLEKPPYRTIRYDMALNSNMDLLEAILLGFPGEEPPGSASNWPDVTLSDGLKWLDTVNHQLKIYYGGTWQVLATLTPAEE